jgi:acyl carrier protein
MNTGAGINREVFMEQKLKKIMADLLEISEGEINDDTSMKTISSWDSLKHLQLILSIEEQFEIEKLSMDEMVEMVSFPRIKDILKEKGVAI